MSSAQLGERARVPEASAAPTARHSTGGGAKLRSVFLRFSLKSLFSGCEMSLVPSTQNYYINKVVDLTQEIMFT